MADDTLEILNRIQKQLDRMFLEPCSPVEVNLINAVSVLINVMRHELTGIRATPHADKRQEPQR